MNELPLKYKLKKKYSIEEFISESDFSNIYLAKYRNKKYIVKECFPSQLVIRDNEYGVFTDKYKTQFGMVQDSFRNEAEILGMFIHKGIEDIEDFFEEKGTVYLILEYCEGRALKDYILEEDLTEIEKMKIFWDIMEIVEEIHSKKVIHRDIKPSNIIIKDDKSIKMIDFGSAIHIKDKNGKYVKLTNGYSPMEMYSVKSENDERTDIYSLSALLYFMLNKQKPMDSVKRFYYPELLYEDMVSENARIFIGKGLEQEMASRYKNIEEMKEEFKKRQQELRKKNKKQNSIT